MNRWAFGVCVTATVVTAACAGGGAVSPTPTVTPLPLPPSTALPSPLPLATAAPAVGAASEATAEPTTAAPEGATASTSTQTPVESPTPLPTARPAPIRIEVLLQITGGFFDPHQIHGNVGDLVVVTIDNGPDRHNFSIDALGVNEDLDSSTTSVVQFRVAEEGITPFYCRIHGTPRSGMHGLLIFH